MNSLPVAIIPARHASTRFPGKPLATLAGRPMVEHVFRACEKANVFGRIIVATDDPRIVAAVQDFGGEAAMTRADCASGTDRVAEVALSIPEARDWVNVQGDEPLMHPEALQTLVKCFADDEVKMATLVRPLDEEERSVPHVVKAVLDSGGDALYFSRADIPFVRDASEPAPKRWAHLGLYAYRRDVLLCLARLPPTPLEMAEKLEQLRALENGVRIRCLITPHRGLGVDTPEDLARAEAALRAR